MIRLRPRPLRFLESLCVGRGEPPNRPLVTLFCQRTAWPVLGDEPISACSARTGRPPVSLPLPRRTEVGIPSNFVSRPELSGPFVGPSGETDAPRGDPLRQSACVGPKKVRLTRLTRLSLDDTFDSSPYTPSFLFKIKCCVERLRPPIECGHDRDTTLLRRMDH